MFIENLDFLTANTLRSFPIKEERTRRSVDDVFTIPDSFIADMVVAASPDVTMSYFISKITNYPDQITIELTDFQSVIYGTFGILTSAHTDFKDYYLTPGESYSSATGKLTIGKLTDIALLPIGIFEFEQEDTELEARVSIPSFTTVNRFNFITADGEVFSKTGNVTIQAGRNIKFVEDGDAVRIDVGDGLGLNTPCGDQPQPIKYINNIGPTSTGHYTITTSDCASITALTGGYGINISDTCCKPCMGCDEISQLTDRANQVETDLIKLRDHYTNLAVMLTQLQTLTGYTCDC